jgi:hypothetical protein
MLIPKESICATREHVDYENDPRPKGSSFIIAMPGSGGELLIDLIASTAMTRVIGNQEPSFYHAITVLTESISSNANTYGHPSDVDDFKFYAARELNQDERMMYYFIRNVLFRGAGNCIGYTYLLRDDGLGWVTRFAQALRNINDSGSGPLRVVFLTCELDDFNYDASIHDDILQSMKDASELGDIWITKKELLADPLKVMLKVKAARYPCVDLIKRVMKKYENAI